VLPGPGEPIPSAFVVATTDAFGNPTQALGLANVVSYSRGIYAPVTVAANYSLTADIRVDQYSDHPESPAADWAMELTFAKAGVANFATTPQVGIYASSLTGGWRLFLIASGTSADIALGVPATIGTWYQVSGGFNALTDTFHTRILNAATGTVLVDQFNTFSGLTPSDVAYDSIAFFGGEVSLGDTVADQAVVDNVNISSTGTVPEPSTLAMFGAGLSLIAVRWRLRA
jgi:hypothetical protein